MANSDNCQNKTDEELAKLAVKKQEYFLYLMKRYEQKLLGYILKITSINEDEAQDILQEVFIKVYRNLNSFDTSLKFSSWIYRITRNQVISHYRHQKTRPQTISWDPEFNNQILNNLVSDIDLHREINLKYLKDNISKVLNNLDNKYREVLILKYLEEKDYREISDILQKPIGTVGTLLNRAKKQFKKELDKNNINL